MYHSGDTASFIVIVAVTFIIPIQVMYFDEDDCDWCMDWAPKSMQLILKHQLNQACQLPILHSHLLICWPQRYHLSWYNSDFISSFGILVAHCAYVEEHQGQQDLPRLLHMTYPKEKLKRAAARRSMLE